MAHTITSGVKQKTNPASSSLYVAHADDHQQIRASVTARAAGVGLDAAATLSSAHEISRTQKGAQRGFPIRDNGCARHGWRLT